MEDEEESEPTIPSPAQLKDPQAYELYRGKVIAIIDGEVLTAADTWAECDHALRKMGVDAGAVVTMKVPPAHFVG